MRLVSLFLAVVLPLFFCVTASAQDVEYVSSIEISATHDVKVADTLVYMACLNSLVIFDISKPEAPVFLRQYFTPDYIYALAISGNYIYLANTSVGMQIINISDPLKATCEGVIATEGSAMGISVSDGLAFVADGIGLQIIDVSIPTEPTLIGSYKTQGHARDVYTAYGYAYVADKEGGLLIIDVSNPSSPKLNGRYKPRDAVWEVRVTDGYAYLAAGHSGLQIVDVINPDKPKLVGSYDTPGNALGVCYSDGYAYVAHEDSGFQIIDVSIPSAPSWAGSYDSRGIERRAYIVNGYVYLTNFFSLIIFRLKKNGAEDSAEDTEMLPDKFTLYQNYPNPFNSTTMIRYELPFQAKVTIVIYDIQGRMVATLIDKKQQAGNHNVLWNAEDVSSGVYFYTIQAGDFTETKQMLLLK